MRKQYYYRASDRGVLAWDVDRLIQLSADLQRKTVPLARISELDDSWCGEHEPPTWRSMLDTCV